MRFLFIAIDGRFEAESALRLRDEVMAFLQHHDSDIRPIVIAGATGIVFSDEVSGDVRTLKVTVEPTEDPDKIFGEVRSQIMEWG